MDRRVEKVSAIRKVANNVGQFFRQRRSSSGAAGQDFDQQLAREMRRKRPVNEPEDAPEAPYVLDLNLGNPVSGHDYPSVFERLRNRSYEK
ncbi:MAG: hypothetical protein IJS96_04985 [Schwartzia sp.]|nr:hypothetical protein [Schwartzia sp. (in: firmicutes)]